MQKVYAVYYDNEQTYEDNQVYIVSIHASEKGAVDTLNELTVQNQFKCMSKEEYYSQHPDDIDYSYEDYANMEYESWLYVHGGKYFIKEYDLLP